MGLKIILNFRMCKKKGSLPAGIFKRSLSSVHDSSWHFDVSVVSLCHLAFPWQPHFGMQTSQILCCLTEFLPFKFSPSLEQHCKICNLLSSYVLDKCSINFSYFLTLFVFIVKSKMVDLRPRTCWCQKTSWVMGNQKYPILLGQVEGYVKKPKTILHPCSW